LILLHTVHDYSLLTSGTAGPFTVEPLSIPLSIGMAALNVAYGVFIFMRPERAERNSQDHNHKKAE